MKRALLLLLACCSCSAPFSARSSASGAGDSGESSGGEIEEPGGQSGAVDVPLGGSPAGGRGGGSARAAAGPGGAPAAGRAGSAGSPGSGSGSGGAAGAAGLGGQPAAAGSAGSEIGSAGAPPDPPGCPELECGGECFGYATPEHCGSCENSCPDGARCALEGGPWAASCVCAGCRDAVGGCVLGVTSGGCATSACEAPCR